MFFQIHSDFVQASTRGAVAAIDGMLTPLNPGDEPRYVHIAINHMTEALSHDQS